MSVNGAAGGKCHNKTYKLNTLTWTQADVDGISPYDAVSLDVAGLCAILLAMVREREREFAAFENQFISLRPTISYSTRLGHFESREENTLRWSCFITLWLRGCCAKIDLHKMECTLLISASLSKHFRVPRGDCKAFSVIYEIGKLFFCERFSPSCASPVHFS